MLTSCQSTKSSIKQAVDISYLTELYLNEDITGNSKYSRKYLIDFVDELETEKRRSLRFDSICSNLIVNTKEASELKISKPHFAIVSTSKNPLDYEHNFKLNVHPIYKAYEKGKFCFIVSSGYNIEYSGEAWARLYKPYYDDSGKLVLGEIIEDYAVWF